MYFLNLVRLDPGQALYLPPGELHVYLRGDGVEVMANSDNVLRGGLTSKHVDVPELLRALSFDSGAALALAAGPDGVYPTPASEFEAASSVGAVPDRPSDRGPDLWLATGGDARILWSKGEFPLVPARPVLVPQALGAYSVKAGAGSTLYRVSVPRSGDAR